MRIFIFIVFQLSGPLAYSLEFFGNAGPSTFGFDASSACDKPYSRLGKAYFDKLPCDFHQENWCNVAGNFYPWHAVKRFVKENQGLMKRMYGEQRHIIVLKNEFNKNDIDLEFNDKYHQYSSSFKRSFNDDDDADYELNDFKGRNFEKKLPLESSSSKSIIIENPLEKSSEKTIKDFTTSSDISEAFTKLLLSSTTVKPLDLDKLNDTSVDQVSVMSILMLSEIAQVKNSSFNEIADLLEPAKKISNQTNNNFGSLNNETAKLQELFQTTTTTTTTVETIDPFGTSQVLNQDKNDEILTTTEAHAQNFRPRPEYRPQNSKPDSSIEGQLFQDVSKDETESPILKLRGINACPVKEEVVAPFWANNTRGEVLALLNLYPFEQYVHWEKCTHEKKQMYCREGCRCEQQYRLHRLLAYDPNNECRGIFSDWFKFPSSCVCRCYDLPIEFRVTSRSPRKKKIKVQLPEINN